MLPQSTPSVYYMADVVLQVYKACGIMPMRAEVLREGVFLHKMLSKLRRLWSRTQKSRNELIQFLKGKLQVGTENICKQQYGRL